MFIVLSKRPCQENEKLSQDAKGVDQKWILCTRTRSRSQKVILAIPFDCSKQTLVQKFYARVRSFLLQDCYLTWRCLNART